MEAARREALARAGMVVAGTEALAGAGMEATRREMLAGAGTEVLAGAGTEVLAGAGTEALEGQEGAGTEALKAVLCTQRDTITFLLRNAQKCKISYNLQGSCCLDVLGILSILISLPLGI
jgi:hypothetical protein